MQEGAKTGWISNVVIQGWQTTSGEHAFCIRPDKTPTSLKRTNRRRLKLFVRYSTEMHIINTGSGYSNTLLIATMRRKKTAKEEQQIKRTRVNHDAAVIATQDIIH